MFKVEIMSNEDREWHESFSLVLGPDDPVEAVLGDTSTATVTILDQEAAGSLILPAPPVVSGGDLVPFRCKTGNRSGILEMKCRAAVTAWEARTAFPTQLSAALLPSHRLSPWLTTTAWKK